MKLYHTLLKLDQLYPKHNQVDPKWPHHQINVIEWVIEKQTWDTEPDTEFAKWTILQDSNLAKTVSKKAVMRWSQRMSGSY